MLNYENTSERFLVNAKKIAFALGILAFVLLGLLLYQLCKFLADFLNDIELANLILYIPSFFACFIIMPVEQKCMRVFMRHYCKKHGHDLDSWIVKDTKYSNCKRCGYLTKE